MSEPDPAPNCCFDEWAAHNAERARSRETVAPVTSAMLAALEAVGIDGRSILDVGCGTGDLALAALAHGATVATGFDLGSGAIENARTLARERGLADRATFEVGDGSVVPLPAADVVVLNRVVCCYPDARGLLDETLGAARAVFAVSAPVDRGPVGVWNRIVVGVSNVWYALRRAKFHGFRVFVHDLAEIDARIRTAGFRPASRERRRIVWQISVYERA